jgi:methylglyoxal synthase
MDLWKKGVALTWGPGLSSDPGSGATAAVAVATVAAAVVAAAGAPRGGYPQVVVAVADPTVVVVVVVADPMVVVAED